MRKKTPGAFRWDGARDACFASEKGILEEIDQREKVKKDKFKAQKAKKKEKVQEEKKKLHLISLEQTLEMYKRFQSCFRERPTAFVASDDTLVPFNKLI